MKNDQRYIDSIASKVAEGNTLDNSLENTNSIFFFSSTDEGVKRNKGRSGARFAPQTISHHFFKFNDHLKKINLIKTQEVSNLQEEISNFKNSQKKQAKQISEALNPHIKNIIHLGGGHDHVYPILRGIYDLNKYKDILIINIDAHCDTRIDTSSHSGTPFRDLDLYIASNKSNSCSLDLFQIGIHKYANSNSTLSPLTKINQTISYEHDAYEKKLEERLSKLTEDSFVFLSLDADGLDSSIMRAVSAVNPNGLSQGRVCSLLEKIKQSTQDSRADKAFGIYEYNPLYDDLCNQGAKVISDLIYRWLS